MILETTIFGSHLCRGLVRDHDHAHCRLSTSGDLNDGDVALVFAQMIRHPAFGVANDPLNTVQPAEPRGAVCSVSAGPDGIYFATNDGPGRPGELIGGALSVQDVLDLGPAAFDDFDDIRVFGGG